MPKLYGARCGENQRSQSDGRGLLPRSVILNICRIELGRKRRDPLVTSSLATKKHKSVLQGASAMGSFAVSSAPERQPLELILQSTTFDFGVGVATRLAHVNRAYVRSSLPDLTGEGRAYASNQRRGSISRRCILQNLDCQRRKSKWGTHG